MTATTAPTPEELAKKLDHMSDISLLYSPNDAVDLGDEAAAMIRAQAVKIAELTAERDELEQEAKDYVSAITYATLRPRPPSQSIAWLKAWATGDKAAAEELKKWKE